MTIPASTNEFPRVIFVEGAAPGTPPSGMLYVYAKADSLLYWKDDTGAEGGPIGGGGSTPALDDLTDVDTTGVSDGDVLTFDSGGSEWVPVAPAGGGGAGGFDPWAIPASPNADDEEGDAALSGWTNRSGASSDANVVSSIIRVYKASAAYDDMVGADKAGTMADGDTWTIGIRDFLMVSNYAAVGLYIADSTPAGVRAFTYLHDGTTGGYFQLITYTGLSTLSAQSNYNGLDSLGSYYAALPMFMRIRRNSATDYDAEVSFGGVVWHEAFNAFNPGFTVARVGLCALSATGTFNTMIAADFLRKNWTP